MRPRLPVSPILPCLILACPLALNATDTELFAEYDQSVEAVVSHANQRLASVEDPMIERHLRSIRSLVELERLRITVLGDGVSDDHVAESLRLTEVIAGGLSDAIYREADLIPGGRRSLIMSFVSGIDASIQYYALSLPTGFDPEVTYPLVVSLHGSGPSHPLFYPHVHFAPFPEDAEPPDPRDDPFVRIMPWGRGNAGYVEYAERDVWECIDDLHTMVTTDPDRRYLTGHSMGARGAWNYAARQPDYWAAVNLNALPLGKGSRDIADVRFAPNLQHLPMRIWLGQQDRPRYPVDARNVVAALQAVGNEPLLVSDPEAGHSPPREQRPVALAWLLEHRRERPDSFRFMTDRPHYRGIWGVRMSPVQGPAVMQTFSCVVQGNRVTVVSHGADGIAIDPGPEGLDLGESGSVIWNGEIVHEGAYPEGGVYAGDVVGLRRMQDRRDRR